MGGVIRAINTHPFTWKDLGVKVITGGFVAFLAGRCLIHFGYTGDIINITCGISGILGFDLFYAVKIRMFKEITGEAPAAENEKSSEE